MMLAYLGFAFALVTFAVALAWKRSGDERQWTRNFLSSFGAPVERERDIDRLSAYFDARGADMQAPAALDDRTWQDLDMDAVFAFLDRSASQVGAQYLFDALRRPVSDVSSLRELDRIVTAFGGDVSMREAVTRELLRLRAWHVSYLPDLLWKELPEPHRARFVFPVLALLPIVLLAISPFWPTALLLMFGCFVVNWGIKLVLRPKIDPYLPALRALPAFLGVAQTLANRGDAPLEAVLARIREHLSSLRFLRTAVRWIELESSRENLAMGAIADLALSLQEYVNLIFLLDVNAFSFAIERIRARQSALRAVFAALGELDVAISIASVRQGAGTRWTRPRLDAPAREAIAQGMTHPLLASPVPNDLRLDGRSWLVTGSNMSGKSTFLRTVGVNALLARTIYTVFATRWEGAPVNVRTCIGRADSIVEGKSYYLAEVERVRLLLDESLSQEPRLFILDELFRGTNTIERVAAARATLETLDVGPHVVIVATHDIELLRWLDGRYAAYHFREQIADGVLSFDHRLYEGPSSTRNAIALLRLMKYPESVVRLAELTAAEEEKEKIGSQQQREPGRE